MKFIQLQRLDPVSLENMGGLYLDPNFIAALVPRLKRENSNIAFTYCEVVMSSGLCYSTPFQVIEILDIIRDHTEPTYE